MRSTYRLRPASFRTASSIRWVGFDLDHTLARYRDAFYQPLISNWDNYDTWVERGSPNAEQAANRTWKELLKDYRQPPLDPGIDAALAEYVARRKRGEKPEI